MSRRLMRFAAMIAAAFTTTAAMATDLESFYFRYDFSCGTKQFIGSASQMIDPINKYADDANFETAYDVNGDATAVHVNSDAYGTDRIGGSAAAGSTVLAGDWTLAMSLKPGDVNRGLLFSLGRANSNGNKAIFFASIPRLRHQTPPTMRRFILQPPRSDRARLSAPTAKTPSTRGIL